MNQQVELPEEIKRWNWGAFLLTPFWCIRHAVWQGLLLFIPLFGLIVPFMLGAKGNQKAWMKNNREPVETFLKRQKYWGFAGLAIWIVGLGSLLGSLLYSLNYSEGMKMGLQIANSNKRLTEYLGQPIEKSSFLNGSYNYIVNPEPSTLAISFHAIGPQSNGHVHFQWEKRGEEWVATEIAFADSEGKTHQLAHSPTIQSSFFKEMPYEKTSLENVLNRMVQERDGYVLLSRSKENNDFIQTVARVSDHDTVVFDVVYSDGYTQWNKKLYQSKDLIQNKEEVTKLFTLYAAGDDSHINRIEWNKLNSITPDPEEPSSAYFRFGEAN